MPKTAAQKRRSRRSVPKRPARKAGARPTTNISTLPADMRPLPGGAISVYGWKLIALDDNSRLVQEGEFFFDQRICAVAWVEAMVEPPVEDSAPYMVQATLTRTSAGDTCDYALPKPGGDWSDWQHFVNGLLEEVGAREAIKILRSTQPKAAQPVWMHISGRYHESIGEEDPDFYIAPFFDDAADKLKMLHAHVTAVESVRQAEIASTPPFRGVPCFTCLESLHGKAGGCGLAHSDLLSAILCWAQDGLQKSNGDYRTLVYAYDHGDGRAPEVNGTDNADLWGTIGDFLKRRVGPSAVMSKVRNGTAKPGFYTTSDIPSVDGHYNFDLIVAALRNE